MINYQGIEDNYLPVIPKPSLQQWDNYQIHDLYCTDIDYLPIPDLSTIPVPSSVKHKSFLAVEAISINSVISCDFNLIANTYK